MGLIVGGVLVGQDLVRAAEVRTAISQVEKYSSAVSTFRSKYNSLPGDLSASVASKFGFVARGPNAGEGDGNGIIEGISTDAAGSNNGFLESGETTTFWTDLGTATLIDDNLSSAKPNTAPAIAFAELGSYFPLVKLGHGNHIYVYSTGGVNYYGISKLSSVAQGGALASSPGMTVEQAFQIDQKVDDGAPTTGNVTAVYNTGIISENSAAQTSAHAANPPGLTDCYDASATPAYAVTVNKGVSTNCALSFRFQ